MRKNESDLIRKKLKETILKMTPYQQDLMLVAVEKMKKKDVSLGPLLPIECHPDSDSAAEKKMQ